MVIDYCSRTETFVIGPNRVESPVDLYEDIRTTESITCRTDTSEVTLEGYGIDPITKIQFIKSFYGIA